MISYPEVLEDLRRHNIRPTRGDYFDFNGQPLEHEYSRFFDFCQEYLDRGDLGYDVRPSRFFYNSSSRTNGCAYTTDQFGIVEIWRGSITWIYDYFLPREGRFNDPNFQIYRTLSNRLQISPGYYLFQMSTLFFLYHETGHLIQQGGPIGENIEYMARICTGDTVRTQHMRELDADAFGCHCLAMHVVMFAEKKAGIANSVDPQLLQDAAALSLAAIFIFFLRISDARPTIYLREKCHPHPMVRLSYCIRFLLDNLAENTTIQLDQPQILKRAIQISEHVMLDADINIVREYMLSLGAQLNAVEAYINEIIEGTKAYPQLCVNRLAKLK